MNPFKFLGRNYKQEASPELDPDRHHIRPGLKPLHDEPIHFVLRSAEATLVLNERRPMESDEITHFVLTGQLPEDW
jgi:hypothetical protein